VVVVDFRKMGDLSEYEKIRLENIKRNESMLKELGFKIPSDVKEEKKAEKITPDRKRKPVREPPASNMPLRKSARLHPETLSDEEQKILQEDKVEMEERDFYEIDPLDSDQLDDFEFQVFVELKKWRLALCREKETEPYKIFQNRTLAEFIRKKRNDRDWAVPADPPTEESTKKLTDDLLMCWGIGPRKVRDEDGYAHQMNKLFLQDNSELPELLEKSRKLSGNIEVPVS
jgi:hypothetical protein